MLAEILGASVGVLGLALGLVLWYLSTIKRRLTDSESREALRVEQVKTQSSRLKQALDALEARQAEEIARDQASQDAARTDPKLAAELLNSLGGAGPAVPSVRAGSAAESVRAKLDVFRGLRLPDGK